GTLRLDRLAQLVDEVLHPGELGAEVAIDVEAERGLDQGVEILLAGHDRAGVVSTARWKILKIFGCPPEGGKGRGIAASLRLCVNREAVLPDDACCSCRQSLAPSRVHVNQRPWDSIEQARHAPGVAAQCGGPGGGQTPPPYA